MANKLITFANKFAGIIDVAAVSAANFLISLFILREMSSGDYAIYVNLFAILMLFSTLQNAFFHTALSVHIAKSPNLKDKKSKAFHICILANIVYILLLLPALLLTYKYSLWFILAIYTSHVLYINRELFRIYNFLFGQKGLVIMAAFVYVFCLLGSLFVCYFLNLNYLIYIYVSLSFALLLAVCILVKGVSFESIRLSKLKESCLLILTYAKWTSLGSVATWAQNNSYTYLATLVVGLESTAVLAAARLVIMPINLVASGIYMAEKPKWALLMSTNKKKLKSISAKVSLLMLTFVILYGGASLLLIDYLSLLMNLQINSAILLFWLIAAAIQCYKFSNSNVLSVSEDFKYLAIMGAIVALIGVFISSVLGGVLGSVGIVMGYCIGELIHLLNTNHRISTQKVFNAN